MDNNDQLLVFLEKGLRNQLNCERSWVKHWNSFSYVSLLTRFIRGRSSLLEMDEFACANIPDEVRAAHEKLFTHLLDGAKVSILS